MAHFTCQAIGIPIPKISWYFNGAPVEKSFTIKYIISEMSFTHATRSSTLTIMNVDQSDIGTYTCDAVNFVDAANSSGVLTVDCKFCVLKLHCELIFYARALLCVLFFV